MREKMRMATEEEEDKIFMIYNPFVKRSLKYST